MNKHTLRRRRSLASGFLTGLAAPALLLAGAFESLPVRRLSGLEGSWRDVGRYIRSAEEQYKRRKSSGEA